MEKNKQTDIVYKYNFVNTPSVALIFLSFSSGVDGTMLVRYENILSIILSFISTFYYTPNFEKVGRAYCFRLVCVCVCVCVLTFEW